MEKNPQLLELEHISQVYGDRQKRFDAVKDVNMHLSEGEFVALVGPSGCGKSTLLRIITGLQQATEGRVIYQNEPLKGINPRAAIVFQTFALFPWLTVLENVEVALKAHDVPSTLRKTRALDLLDRVGLDGFETAYPKELSGGMRQKVGFARAMAVEPELLCLDEPFSALDVLSAEALRGELLELWTGGNIPTRAILMVTHNIEEAVYMADRVVVMDKGPGRVMAELRVPLLQPRNRKDPAFVKIVDRVYSLLAGQTQPEYLELGTAPGEPGHTRSLPYISINELSGLLEHLGEMQGDRADIFRLAEELQVNSDSLLPLIEAAELLGFATVAQGDITLAPLGETFADASILSRKEIFATRIRRLPIFKWLIAMLNAAAQHKLEREVVQTALELEFPSEEAEKQLEVAIKWGRYSEILVYEDDAETIYLEPGRGPHPFFSSGEGA